MNLFIKIILFFFILEFFLFFYLKFLRSNFQWLILKKFDLSVKFSEDEIKKFKQNSYDRLLGWSPRPNKIKFDLVKSFGEKSHKKFRKVKYETNKYCARFNPSFEKKEKKIFTFGDSFVFSRHVNDDETWQNELSFLTRSNVVNFGVGNYGVDQSFLRMENVLKNKKNKIVIMGFVPETIVRIHSCWRHFYEYGNTLAFKPRFFLNEKKMKLSKNPITKINDLNRMKEKLNFLTKNDFWYKEKFSKDLMRAPYLLNIFKNLPKNILLIINLTLSNLFNSHKYHNNAWKIILDDNFKYVHQSYKRKEMVELLSKEIKMFSEKVKKNKGKPLVIIFPYLQDLNYISDTKNYYYLPLLNKISKSVDVFDLSKIFLKKKNLEKYFVNSYYGSHFSKKGNKVCAEEIYNFLKKKKMLNN